MLATLVPAGKAAAQTKGGTASTPGSKEARLPAPTLTAKATGPGCVHVSWTSVPGAKSYVLGRATDNTGFQRVNDLGQGPVTEYFDNSFRRGTMAQYRITAIDSSDIPGMAAKSNVLSANGGELRDCSRPLATSTGTGAPGISSPVGGGALLAGAELSFAVSGSMSLRAGATGPAGSVAGSQWSSLDPNVASVNPDGMIKARAAGEARVVAVSPSGSGGVRVTVVRVVVTP